MRKYINAVDLFSPEEIKAMKKRARHWATHGTEEQHYLFESPPLLVPKEPQYTAMQIEEEEEKAYFKGLDAYLASCGFPTIKGKIKKKAG